MPYRFFLLIGLLFCLSLILISCHRKKDSTQVNKNKTEQEQKEKDKINLGQEVANRIMLQDSIFIHFEKNWQQFIAPARELLSPVNLEQKAAWEPLIFSDCRYYQDAHTNVPQVTISWNEPASQVPFRFDIALHYQGFEKNYYTSVFPVEKLKRFNIPQNSQFLKDTTAVLLTGPPLFPKIIDMEQHNIQTENEPKNLTYQRIPMVKQTLRITELGQGLSYRIRKCSFDGQQWKPTREITFTTPICPVDMK